MLWISKLSEMEDEEIIKDNTESEGGQQSTEANQGKNEIPVQPESGIEKKDISKKPLFVIVRSFFIFICTVLLILAMALFILYVVPVLEEIFPRHKTESANNKELNKDPVYKKQMGLLTKDIQRLSLRFNAYTSGQSYIVINTIENKFALYTNKKLIREGFCSSGSYTMLQTSGNKKWIFKTPKGKYWVHGKITNPVWKRPDWSFVEEGSPIPSENADSRFEYGVLGDYALILGDGYMIHGTIYKRFLGMPVTHGCVRLNDDDLKVIYNTLNIGSKVYIY
jgi:lipoprotein-anchoring transpeptidase ErfK/SrfK